MPIQRRELLTGFLILLVMTVVLRLNTHRLLKDGWYQIASNDTGLSLQLAANTTKHYHQRNHVKPIKILYWTAFYGKMDWYGMGTAPFKDCEYSACSTTGDKAELSSSDALLIHMRDVGKVANMPKSRSPNQTWIMYMRESPVHAFIKYTPFNHLFNASMTYKNASDIYVPSVSFARKRTTSMGKSGYEVGGTENYAAGKTRLVAWFVSNCRTSSKREEYVRELGKHIDVHIYGACGTLKCPKTPGKAYSAQCDLQLKKNYKFYLAFENSICSEYFTEKVVRTYSIDVVPVVLGGAKYSKIFPRHSFINVRQFPSPEKLADYLKLLDSNDTLYNEYFAWKKNYVVQQVLYTCRLCEYLHKSRGRHSTLNRIDLFWNKYKDCSRPKSFYRGIADIPSLSGEGTF